MKTLAASILCVGALFASACGGAGGLDVAYGGKEAALDPMHGVVVNDVVSEAVAHQFAIANYQLDTKRGLRSMHQSAKAEGNLRVEFTILGEKGTARDAPVRVGEYPTRPGNAGAPYNTVISARIARAEGGKEASDAINQVDVKPGKVTITSVAGDEVAGVVDLTDGKQSIRGRFTAKIVSQ